MTRAAWILVATVAIALAAAVAWSASTLADARQQAADAAADTAACRQLSGRIATLRHATTGPANGGELGPLLEAALSTAEVEADAVARVAPQPPARTADGGPARRSTQIALRAVTLHQALSFVAALTAGPGGVRLDTFRLTVPNADAGGPPLGVAPPGDDEWDAELSVSQPGGR